MRIEADDFEFLAPAYVRSFLRNYARFLRVDPEPVIEQFNKRFAPAALETGSIVAIERRINAAPPKRRMNSWAVAAVIALGALTGLAAIGLAEPDDSPSLAGLTSPDENDGEVASPVVTPEPDESTVALDQGIDLTVVASKAPCWLEIYADGKQLYYQTLQVGDRETFHATNRMFVRLGFPQGVELIVNGKNIGSPGGRDPIELLLPRDVRSLF